MYSFKSTRMSGREQVAQLCLIGGQIRRDIQFCNFLVGSPKGTVFLYLLDTFDISKNTDKVFKMLDDVVDFLERRIQYR